MVDIDMVGRKESQPPLSSDDWSHPPSGEKNSFIFRHLGVSFSYQSIDLDIIHDFIH